VSENEPQAGPNPDETSGQIPVSAQVPFTPAHPILEFSDADLAAMLRRAIRLTTALGAGISVVLALAMGWQTGALFAVGAALSVGSIYEWARLIRLITARMDGLNAADGSGTGSGRGSGLRTGVVVVLFLLRLAIFAGVIYGSLKCFHGSPIALLCGLSLALAGLVWEALRVLRA